MSVQFLRPKSKNAREGIETVEYGDAIVQALQGPKSKNAREGIETFPREFPHLQAEIRPKSKNAREGIETIIMVVLHPLTGFWSEKQKCPRGH